MKEIIRTYEKVNRFDAKAGTLLLYLEDKSLSVDDVVVEEHITEPGYELYEDVLFYSGDKGSTYIYRIADKSKNIFKKEFSWGSYVDGTGVFTDDHRLFYNVDIQKGDIVSTFTLQPEGNLYYFKDHIIHVPYENLKLERILCYDRLEQRYQWEYGVAEEGRYSRDIKPSPEKSGEVTAVLGIFKSILIVAITGERLVAIDMHTGKKIWKVEFVPEAVLSYMRTPKLPSAMDFKIDEDTGRLISFYQNIYINIDIATGEVKKVINELDRFRVQKMTLSHHGWYHDGAVIYYFAPGFREGIPQVIAYDTDSRAVLWTHVIQKENLSPVHTKYFIKSMQYDNGNFFVLDSNDVLTILKN